MKLARTDWKWLGALLLPLILYLPGLWRVPFAGPEADYTDLLISHYPAAAFLRRSLLEAHAVPLWAPYILGGYPFAADPLSGLWYPPGWLVLLLPLPWGFTWLVMAHLFFGGLGVYLWGRRVALPRQAALLGALVFVAWPRFVAQFAAGHITLLYASAWLPWVLLVAGRSVWQAGVTLALVFLADPRLAPFAGLVWLAGVLDYVAHSHNSSGAAPLQHLWKSSVALLLAVLLTAPLWMPLLEYAALSTRARMQPDERLLFSLPPARLLGLWFPDFGAFPEWVLYPGASAWVLLLASWKARARRGVRLGWAFLLTGLLLSLGKFLPGMAWLVDLPGWDVLRVPPRALVLCGLGLALLSMEGAGVLLSGRLGRALRLALTAVSLFALFMALGARWLMGQWLPELLWGAGFLTLAAVLTLLWDGGRLSARTALRLLAAILLVDLLGVGRSLVDYRPAQEALAPGEAVARLLAAQEGVFRVYSPSYSLPQHLAVEHGLELADGVDPLQLRSYADFLSWAAGVPLTGYSVTLPPFENGDPQSANRFARPDAAALGLLNVRFVVSAFPLDGVAGLKKVREVDGAFVYRNLLARPRAWVGEEETWSAAGVEHLSPNVLAVQARGPGKLVLSEIAYPGWQAWLDGRRVPWQVEAGVFRSLLLPAGRHEIIFRFVPWRVYLGLALAALGWLAVLWTARLERRCSR